MIAQTAARFSTLVHFIVLVAPVLKTQPWYQHYVDKPSSVSPSGGLDRSQLNVTISLSHVAHRYRGQNLSEEATDQSCRTKTNDSLLRKWCHQRGCDPFLGPVTEVANFLAHLFAQGYQYNSINAYRSAISSAHEKEEGYSVGQHQGHFQ